MGRVGAFLTAVRTAPGFAVAARRAARVTLAAGAAFYLFLYGFGDTVAATYALFGAVSLAGLSRIPGTGRQRAEVLVRLLPVSWLLITAGTFLAVRTWSAVAGMLVIGFALAFIAVGGPRPAGAAPGLQLLYILPSFPPYAPETLGHRLLGATVGILLLLAAEVFLFPEPPTVPYRELAARALDAAEHCAGRLAAPPYRLSAEDLDAAEGATGRLRPLTVPEADRPAGPSVRDRALAHTGLATRTLLSRLARLPAGPAADGDRAGAEVLGAVRRTAAQAAARLRGVPPVKDAVDAREGLLRSRAALVAARAGPTGVPVPSDVLGASGPSGAWGPSATPARLRRHAAVLEVADAALAAATAADLALRGRAAAAGVPTMRFWYARMRAPHLWWIRLWGYTGSRSVFFQNAVRISLALAAARAIAGLDTLPHGFWATLAALTLTRTTVRETGTTIRAALTGTLAGALVTGSLLTLVDTHTNVYAAAMVPVMLLTFTLGPVKGVGWAQGLFTLTVALVFAQLAPASWQLAEFRLLDVLIGSVIGAVFGLLAWPRGAHEELQRSGAVLLRGAAEVVVATTASIAAGGAREAMPVVPGRRSLRHALYLAESAYAQFQSEPATPPGQHTGAIGAAAAGAAGVHAAAAPGGPRADPRDRPDPPEPPLPSAAQEPPAPELPEPLEPLEPDWQATLMAGHHTQWGADRLLEPAEPLETGPVALPPLGHEAAAAVTRLGDRVAGRMLLVSGSLDRGSDTPSAPVPLRDPAFDDFEAEPDGAPWLYYATVFWLDSLMTDLERITGTARA
ncbi:FUSC family protein [Streptomyces sp. HUAS TT3]|uniref:FUSC family protein n=1 Tax=Streptomyces sp. HUAS TT3 TaxID=3447510 RepID=UPI003F65C3D9